MPKPVHIPVTTSARLAGLTQAKQALLDLVHMGNSVGNALGGGIGLSIGQQLAAGIGGAVRGMGDLIGRGVRFNATLADSRLGVAALLRQMDPQRFGQFTKAVAEADRVLAVLQDRAAKSPLTFGEMLETFQTALPLFAQAKIGLQDQIDLVIGFSNALRAMGVPAHQASQELRAILTADVANSRIARVGASLFPTDEAREQLRLALANGTAADLLKQKFLAFNEAAEAAQGNLNQKLSNTQDELDRLTSMLSKPIYDRVNDAAGRLLNLLKDPAIATGFRPLVAQLDEAMRKALELSETLARNPQILADIVSWGAKAAGALAGLSALALLGSLAAHLGAAIPLLLKLSPIFLSITLVVQHLNAILGELGVGFGTFVELAGLQLQVWLKEWIKTFQQAQVVWMTFIASLAETASQNPIAKALFPGTSAAGGMAAGALRGMAGKLAASALSADSEIAKLQAQIAQKLIGARTTPAAGAVTGGAAAAVAAAAAAGVDNRPLGIAAGVSKEALKIRAKADLELAEKELEASLDRRTISLAEYERRKGELLLRGYELELATIQAGEDADQEKAAKRYAADRNLAAQKIQLAQDIAAKGKALAKNDAAAQAEELRLQNALAEVQQRRQLIEADQLADPQTRRRALLSALEDERQALLAVLDMWQRRRAAIEGTGPESDLLRVQTDREISGVQGQLGQLDAEGLRLRQEAYLETPMGQLTNWVNQLGTFSQQAGQALTQNLGTAIDGISAGIWNVISGTGTWADAMRQTAATIIQSLIKIGVQMVVQAALGKSLALGSAATTSAAMTTTATAAAPAAAATSVASFGSSAVMGTVAAVAAIAAIIAAITGAFADGGLIPGAPSRRDNRLAHVATGEFITKAPAVSHYGPAVFDAFNEMKIPMSWVQSLGLAGGRGASSGSHFSGGGLVGAGEGISVQPNIQVIMVNSETAALRAMRSRKGAGVIVDQVTGNATKLGMRGATA